MVRSHIFQRYLSARYQNNAMRCPSVAISRRVKTCGAVNMAVSIEAACRVAAQTVDQSNSLGLHDQAQILTRSPFMAERLAVPDEIQHHRVRRPVLGMEELLSCDLEAERLVVRQQRGDAIDVVLLDLVADAVPNHGRDQLPPGRATAFRFPDDELRANRRGFGMMR